MKSLRGLIILGVILVLLVGALVYVSNMKVANTESVDNTIKILQLNAADISGVTIENADGKFTFGKENDLWKLTSSQNLKIDSSRIESIASGMATLAAEKVIEENSTNLAQYGLDKPVVVSVKLKDGTVKSIDLGNETSTFDGFYMKETGKNKVYTLSTYAGSTLKVTRNDIRDKAIFIATADEMNSFTFERDGKTLFKASKSKVWTMSYPSESWLDSTKMSSILGEIASVSVMNFIEDNPVDLGKYGLKNPAYVMDISSSAGKTKLLLGTVKDKEANEIYAKLDSSNEVFTVNESVFSFLDKPMTQILSLLVFTSDISDVSGIVVDMDGKSTTSVLQVDPSGDNTKDKFTVNGKDGTANDPNGNSLFRSYYQALTGIAINELDPNAKPSSGKADITITFKLKTSPDTMKFEFVAKNEDSYYVMKNGKYTGFVVLKSEFDKDTGVRVTFNNLLAGLK